MTDKKRLVNLQKQLEDARDSMEEVNRTYEDGYNQALYDSINNSCKELNNTIDTIIDLCSNISNM